MKKMLTAPDGKAWVYWVCREHQNVYHQCKCKEKIPVHLFYEEVRAKDVELCGRNVIYADTERHEGIKVVWPKGPCKMSKGHKGECSFFGANQWIK